MLYKLFTELGIQGRMWLAIKDLHTDVKAQVLFVGELSREFDISQGTGQGRILAPFMYTVYINSLLNTLAEHSHAISINCLRVIARRLRMMSPCMLCSPHFESVYEHLSSVQ